LTFRVCDYSLVQDVLNTQSRPSSHLTRCDRPPLVVMSNFGNEKHTRLAMASFRKLFEPLALNNVNPDASQRVVLVCYDEVESCFQIRHYIFNKVCKERTLTRQPNSGVDVEDESRAKLSFARRATNLAGNMSQGIFLHATHEIAGRSFQDKVCLREVGPRLKLELKKVEEGLCTGTTLYDAGLHT